MEKQNHIKFKKVKEDGYYSYHLPIKEFLDGFDEDYGIIESVI